MRNEHIWYSLWFHIHSPWWWRWTSKCQEARQTANLWAKIRIQAPRYYSVRPITPILQWMWFHKSSQNMLITENRRDSELTQKKQQQNIQQHTAENEDTFHSQSNTPMLQNLYFSVFRSTNNRSLCVESITAFSEFRYWVMSDLHPRQQHLLQRCASTLEYTTMDGSNPPYKMAPTMLRR